MLNEQNSLERNLKECVHDLSYNSRDVLSTHGRTPEGYDLEAPLLSGDNHLTT